MNRLNLKISLLAATFSLIMLPDIYAQVTIGSNIKPEQAALLDLKTIETGKDNPQGATTDKKGGGLLLPRIELDSKDSFSFIDKTDLNYSEECLRHTGMLVYNLKTTADGLSSGICMWNGHQWTSLLEALSLEQKAWLTSGNSGTDETKHYLGTSDEKAFSIKTNNQTRIYVTSDGKIGIGSNTPGASLHVDGNMKLMETPVLEKKDEVKVLAINKNGQIGTSASIPTKLMVVEGVENQIISTTADKTSFNNADVFVVTWDESQVYSNNLMDFDDHSNSFIFRESVLCEVSGYINYCPFATPSASFTSDFQKTGAALNVIIQYQESGSNDWIDFTAARSLWIAGAVKEVKTVNVPPAIKIFQPGDRLRMIFKRPNSVFALPHHSSGNGGITSNSNSNVKGLKIIAM